MAPGVFGWPSMRIELTLQPIADSPERCSRCATVVAQVQACRPAVSRWLADCSPGRPAVSLVPFQLDFPNWCEPQHIARRLHVGEPH